MGLSKHRRDRNTARQVESARSSLDAVREFLQSDYTLTDAALGAAGKAVQLRLWLEGMQKQLEYTSRSLRTHPASILASFQKILRQPSYFFAPTGAKDWLILLGPRKVQPAILLELAPRPVRLHDPMRPVRRLLRRILEQGSTLERDLVRLQFGLENATDRPMSEQRAASLAVYRRAQRMERRLRSLKAPASMYTRMFSLQAQRFSAMASRAEEIAHAYTWLARSQTIALTVIAAPSARFDFVAPQPLFLVSFFRALHQWLMHPVIDTRI